MTRNWKNFYQLWVKQQDKWGVVFSSADPVAVRDVARSGVNYNSQYVDRIELRDYWGDSVLETVFDKSWK